MSTIDLTYLRELPRDTRMHVVSQLYETVFVPKGKSYQDLADASGLTRGQVAGDIRDSKSKTLVPLGKAFRRSIARRRRKLLSQATPTHYPQNIAVMDIEVSSLIPGGSDGYIVCACFLDVNTGELITEAITYDEITSADLDGPLMERIYARMGDYAFLIGHNIARFDDNWLLTRAIELRMDAPPFHHYADTLTLAQRILLGSKSLKNLIDRFGLEAEKTSVNRIQWSGVRCNDEDVFNETMFEIMYHCQQDVIANLQVWDYMYPYLANNRKSGPIWRDYKMAGGSLM